MLETELAIFRKCKVYGAPEEEPRENHGHMNKTRRTMKKLTKTPANNSPIPAEAPEGTGPVKDASTPRKHVFYVVDETGAKTDKGLWDEVLGEETH